MTETAIPNYLAGTWRIDRVHSVLAFAIRHMMVSKVRGRFDVFAGTVVTAHDPLESTASAEIEANSINTDNSQRDAQVRSADFFDSKNHPNLTFRSTEVKPAGDRYLATGDLTIRGVTRSVELLVELNGITRDPDGGTRIGLSATGEVNRKDFGVNYNGPIPGGGTVLADKVKIEIEVEAVLED